MTRLAAKDDCKSPKHIKGATETNKTLEKTSQSEIRTSGNTQKLILSAVKNKEELEDYSLKM